MKVAGIDIGFGDTKVWCRDKYFKFPTAVAIDYGQGVDLGSFASKKTVISYNGKKYMLGEEALLHDPLPTRTVDFLREYTPLIIAYAKKFADFHEVTLGLPLGFYKDHKDEIKNNVTRFRADGKDYSFNVNVLPQGAGIAYDYMYDDHAQRKNVINNAAVIDIGYNTIDVLSIINGSADSTLSFMLDNKGVCQIVIKLMDKLGKKYKHSVDEFTAKKFLETKKYVGYGLTEDITDICTELIKEYADKIVNELFIKANDVLGKADLVIFSGGGTALIKEYISDDNKKRILFLGDDLAEYSNARGFYKQNVRGRLNNANINHKKG